LAVIAKILDQHFEEASLLWLRRDRAVGQPQFAIKSLVRLDGRLDAHIDGLLVGESDSPGSAWEILRQGLDSAGPGEAFVGAMLAFQSYDSGRIQRMLQLGGATRENSRALVSALSWLPYEGIAQHLGNLLVAPDRTTRRIAIAALAAHRCDPGVALSGALSDSDAGVRARALRATGELGRTDLLEPLRAAISDSDEECRFWASWSAARFSGNASIEVLSEIAGATVMRSEAAAAMAMRVADRATAVVLQSRLGNTRTGVIAAGALGDPALAPWLIARMSERSLARVEGAALSMITGLDLLFENLGVPRVEGLETGPTEESEDENVAMDPDEDLPWPKVEGLIRWWEANGAHFHDGVRYLAGKPMTGDWLEQVLRSGFQPHRAAAAMELAIHHPVEPLFEVRAPAFRQLRHLRDRRGAA
jgi:uncharacterized protein (TIGR02270 family)